MPSKRLAACETKCSSVAQRKEELANHAPELKHVPLELKPVPLWLKLVPLGIKSVPLGLKPVPLRPLFAQLAKLMIINQVTSLLLYHTNESLVCLL